VIHNFTFFLFLFVTLTVSAQTADDCTVDTATPIISGLDLIASDQPYTEGVSQTYCFDTDLPIELVDGLGVVKLTSDLPGGYPFLLLVTDLVTNITYTLSEFGDSIIISEGQLYFIEIMPTAVGTGEIALIPTPFLVTLGAEQDTVIVEVIDAVCPTPAESFTCGNQNYFQVQDNLSEFTFSTDDDAYPTGGDWTIDGLSYESYSTASLETIDGILRFDIPQSGTYEICYENLDEDGCSNYCCRTYCLDDEFLNYDIDFGRAPDGTSYNITLDLQVATNVSYYGGEPFVEGLGSSFLVPFPSVEDCYFTDYTFRYQKESCWKTARLQAYICNPYDCNDSVYGFDQQNESWELSFSATNPSSITWFDDDNEGTILEGGMAALRLDSRPEGQCGPRNISVRYFDELNWRHCGLRFWDCNPYDCANFTTQTDEAGEALNLTFNGSNATQITWSNDATGQNIEDSDGQMEVLLPWPETDCQTRFISVRYFDSVLGINRTCSIEVEVCRPSPCEEPTTSLSCGHQRFYQNGINGGSGFSFSTSDPTYPNLGNWRIDGNDYSGVSYANLLPDGTLECDFPVEGSYEICYLTVDEDGCEDYCCRNYCIDFIPPVEPTTFEVAGDGQGYDLTFSLAGASDVSWYVPGQPGMEGDGTSVNISFPVEGCFYQTYYFRYFEGGCWKTAVRRVYVCNPFNCNDIIYDFNRQEQAWNLFFTATNANSITWIDGNGGATLANGTTILSVDSSPEGQCGLRNISVHYFDGLGWRYCSLRFWDCNPYSCANFTTQMDEAGEALNLIFSASNATQITWSDDAAGQSIQDSDGETVVPLLWPGTGCQTRSICVRYFDVALEVFRFCCIDVEVCSMEPCEEPTQSFSCGNQQFYQDGISGGSDFTFSTTDPAHPDLGNWRIDGNDYSDINYANLLSDGSLECNFSVEGSYEICYVTVNGNGCEDYCCRNYCVDFTPPVEPTTFEVADDGQGYDLTFSLVGASDVSWYVPGQPGLEGDGASVNIPFPVEDCFYQTYYFRYFEGGCWKTAVRRVYVCNSFNCNDVVYTFDRQDEAWDLSFTAADANSVIWLDDDNGGATLAIGTTALRINPRPEGQCGFRNISIRYFDGLGWRYCSLLFWDCNPYDCANFTTQTDETGEALNLTFIGLNATQITWSDDVTGQNLQNSDDQTVVLLPWPDTGCQTRFISVRYFDSVLGVFRICCIEVEVCRSEICNDNDFVDNCNDFEYFRLGLGSYAFTSAGEVAENENWLINRVPSSEAGYPATTTQNTLSCVFPEAGTYEICYPFLDEDGCVDYCCKEYCIDVVSNEALIDFNYEGVAERYRLRLDVEETTQVTWYYFNDLGNLQEVGSGSTAYVSAPAPGNCFTRTYYFSYLDVSGCPRVAFRRVRICNPLICGNISYRYDRANNEYDLTFTGDGLAGSLQWLDDDAGGIPFNSSTEQQSVPLLPGAICGPRNISIRYFDGESWSICSLRYWACNPYECNDLTATNDANSEQYTFNFTGSNFATEISWEDDVSGSEVTGSSGQREVILSYPEEGCITRYISIRYFDPGFGGYRLCCIEQEICRPEPCDTPVFSENCSNQNYYRLQNGNYRFTTSSTVAEGETWLVNGNPEGDGGDSLTLSLPAAGSYAVCYPYLDGNGCLNYCCRTYCIDSESEAAVDYGYENNGNTLRLELTEQGATSVDWYFYDNGVSTSLGNGQIITRTVPPTCGFITYYVRYFSGGCWKVNARTIWVCNPFRCEDISFAYNQASGGFDLELTAGGMVSSISWQDDDTGFVLDGSVRMLSLPLDGECRYRNVSARYFDGTGWRVCGLRLYVCDPYACGDISYGFAPDSNVIDFNFTGADSVTDISWTDDDLGQPLPGSGDSTTLIWDGDCRVRNISIRYRDPVMGGWRVCGFRFFACAPSSCGSLILFERGDGDEVLIFTDEDFTQLSWAVDGADAGTENVLGVVIPPGESRTVCVRYFDPANGYFRTCCRTITIPGCDLPVPVFRVERNMDTITVVNESPDADVTYLWEFGELAQSTLPQPPSLNLPVGRYLICLTVTNSCGPQQICREVVIRDPANNLVMELGAPPQCAAPGETVSVPLSIRNFRDITSFQFSLSLPMPRYGRFKRLRFQNEDGIETGFVLNDSTLAVTWIRTDTLSATIADETVIGMVDIELTGNEIGTGAVVFSDFPTASGFEYIDEQAGLLGMIDGSYKLCLSTGSISGRVRREDGAGVGEVIVLLEYNGLNVQSLTTDATGEYIFTGLRPERSYMVVTVKDTNYRNGVTSGDLSRILQHLSQSPELATPYKRIAADVSSLGQITEGDISAIRQLIFRELTSFEDVSSWGFVPLAYNFPDPDSPHDPSYPDGLNFTASSVELSAQDFMGMKMGDIGDSADPENLNGGATDWVAKSLSDLSFELSSGVPIRNQVYQVDVRASDFANLLAAQFSLGWDNNQLRFDSLSNLNEELELNDENFSTVSAASGRLAWLWFAALPVSLADSSLLFRVHFTVTGEVGQELAVSFTENPTEFSFEDTDSVLIASFTDLQRTIELPTSNRSFVAVKEWRVFPNPATKWINVATIGGGFGPERLELFDSRGRSVRNWTSTAEGKYSIAGLPTGVYQFMLSSAVGVQVSRLVVVD
jgi:hypothetical protein